MTTAQICLFLLTVNAAPAAGAKSELKCAEHNCAITLPAATDWQDFTATAKTHGAHTALSVNNARTKSNLTVSVQPSKRPPVAPEEVEQFIRGYIRSSEKASRGKLSKTYGRWTSVRGLRTYEFGVAGNSRLGRISNSVRFFWADGKLYVLTWFVAKGDAERDPDCLQIVRSFRFLKPPGTTTPPPPPGVDHIAEGEQWGKVGIYIGIACVIAFLCVRGVVRMVRKKSG